MRLENHLDAAWAAMAAGAAPGKSRFSMIQAANVGLDGGPRVRTVVIRDCNRAARTLAFHTDARSPKIAELAADPRIEVIGYDMEAGLQARMSGVATVHEGDEVAKTAWDGSRNQSKLCYRSGYGPGTPLADPALGDATEAARTTEDPMAGYDNFRRVVIHVSAVDWLDLASTGHRRARFRWTGEDWSGEWLAP